MKYQIFLSSVLAMLTMVGCNKNEKVTRDLQDSLAENKRQMQETIDKANADLKAKAEANDRAEKALDTLASGGQPGSVTLTGSLVEQSLTLSPKVSVLLEPGVGWRGTAPELDSKKLTLKADLDPAQLKSLDELKADSTYVNFGCDLGDSDEVKGLTEQKIAQTPDSKGILEVKAQKIFICEDGFNSVISKNAVTVGTLASRSLYLVDAKVEMIGPVGNLISITTERLSLAGVNTFKYSAPNGETTLLPGPSFYLTAIAMDGDGKISILSTGASYEPKKTENSQNDGDESQ